MAAFVVSFMEVSLVTNEDILRWLWKGEDLCLAAEYMATDLFRFWQAFI